MAAGCCCRVYRRSSAEEEVEPGDQETPRISGTEKINGEALMLRRFHLAFTVLKGAGDLRPILIN